jgi:hypothetical protein
VLSDNAGLASNTEPSLEATAALYGLPVEEVLAVARHMGFPRDAEGYFLDESTDSPLRLDADEVHGWYVRTDEKFRRMGLLTSFPPAAPPVAYEARGGTRLPAARYAA